MERSVGVCLLLCLVVVALANTEDNDNAVAKHWALIVAGSSGYFNYRHQVRFVTVSHLWLYLDSCIQVHCRCYSEIKENIGYFNDSTIETLVVANAGVMDLGPSLA